MTIKPGTTITGTPGSALIITHDASISAQGSKELPIVMTSAQAEGKRRRGDWGGLVLLGNADAQFYVAQQQEDRLPELNQKIRKAV